MVFYNFCYYFWGQRCCCAKTSIIGNDLFVFCKLPLPSTLSLLPLPYRCSGIPVSQYRIWRCLEWEKVATRGNQPRVTAQWYLCGYIVARFISLLGLHSFVANRYIVYVVLQQEILQYVEISVFGKIRCMAPKYGRILRGGSKVPHRWFIDPTHVGPMSQKNFFFHITFSASSWNYILPTFCMWIERERWLWFMLNFGALLANLCDLWPET